MIMCIALEQTIKTIKITQIVSVIDKELTAKQFVQPLVVIGDGDNDSGMAQVANISVGFWWY